MENLPQSRARTRSASEEGSECAHTHSLLSTFPISPPGCRRPPLPRVSLRLHPSKHMTISTGGSALDPPPLALPISCLDVTNHGSRPHESVSGPKTGLLPFSIRSLHMPPRRQLFSHWTYLVRYLLARLSLSVPVSKGTMNPRYESNIRICPHR